MTAWRFYILVAISSPLLCFYQAAAETNDVTIASLSSDEVASDDSSVAPALSSDGQKVIFQSDATNLITGDNNGKSDIFLRDRQAGTTSLLSLDTGSGAADGDSSSPSVDDDASIVAFASRATDLVNGDNNGAADIFVVDRGTSTVTRVSVDTGGSDPDGISAAPAVNGSDGRYVVFESSASDLVTGDTNGFKDIFLRDRTGGTTTHVSLSRTAGPSNGASFSPAINNDGSVIVFASDASDITAGDTNGSTDVFAYVVSSTTNSRVSVDTSGSDADGDSSSPSVSSDGRFVAFQSDATDLVSGDSNGKTDIFVRDRTAGTSERVSLSTAGSSPNGNSIAPVISADGRYVIFLSDATDLVSGDANNTAGDGSYDVFVYDRTGDTTERINRTVLGGEIDGTASDVAIDGDGSIYAFSGDFVDLVTDDINESTDIFAVDEACPTDTDGDSTVNCSDGCPFDSGKTAAGTCGCGVADTDSDSDGTANCLDNCDDDAAKTEAGVCGCGVAEADANGNGVFDCLDPTSSDVPKIPKIKIKGDKVSVFVPKGQFRSVNHRIEIFQGKRKIAQKVTAHMGAHFTIEGTGTFNARYRFELGEVTTKYSRRVSFGLN